MATKQVVYPDSPNTSSFEQGAEFLDLVTVTLQKYGLYLQAFTSKKFQYERGESLQGWEVKLDNRFTDTGRLSIEVAEKTRADQAEWIPSGIYRGDSWLYIQGNKKCFYIFTTKVLQWLHSTKKYTEKEELTIKTFYLPIKIADYVGKKVIP